MRLVLTFFFVFLTANVWSMSNEEISALLTQALNNTFHSDFKATGPTLNGKPSSITVFHSSNSDGKRLDRYESSLGVNRTSVFLVNPDGGFLWVCDDKNKIIQSTAIKNNMIPIRIYDCFETLDSYRQVLPASYTLAEKNYRGIPCYRISVEYPRADKNIAKIFTRFTPEQVARDIKFLRYAYLVRMEIFVGKDKPFIYACYYYNMYGNLRVSMDWGAVEFLSLDPVLFNVPRGISIKVAQTPKEVQTIGRKLYAPKGPSIFARVGNSIGKTAGNISAGIDNNFSDITTWMSWILFWFSVIVFVTAIVLKIRKRRTT